MPIKAMWLCTDQRRVNGMQMTLLGLNPEIYQMPIATAEDFHANLSQLLESEGGSQTLEALYFLKSCGWLEKESLNIFSLKTSPDYFHTITEIPSLQSFSPLPTVGMMCNGKYLIA